MKHLKKFNEELDHLNDPRRPEIIISDLQEKIEFIKKELDFIKHYEFDGGMTPDQYLREGCSSLEYASIRIAQKLGII